jgi:hypothetical protein
MGSIQELIKKYKLTAESTPCEICSAMNKSKGANYCPVPYARSSCLDKDRAIIRLAFLQLAGNYLKI